MVVSIVITVIIIVKIINIMIYIISIIDYSQTLLVILFEVCGVVSYQDVVVDWSRLRTLIMNKL